MITDTDEIIDAIGCPRCDAQPGELCWAAHQHVGEIHDERRWIAMEMEGR